MSSAGDSRPQGPPGNSWDRCVECQPFKILEGRVGRMDERLIQVERQVTDHGRDIRDLSKKIGRVVHWLDGNGGKDRGFKVEWALISSGIKKGAAVRERILWMVGGAAGLMILGFVGKVFLDAIQRGIAP